MSVLYCCEIRMTKSSFISTYFKAVTLFPVYSRFKSYSLQKDNPHSKVLVALLSSSMAPLIFKCVVNLINTISLFCQLFCDYLLVNLLVAWSRFIFMFLYLYLIALYWNKAFSWTTKFYNYSWKLSFNQIFRRHFLSTVKHNIYEFVFTL